MDILCKYCREPWETDCLHDVVAEGHAVDFSDARSQFYRLGCPAMDGGVTACKRGGAPDPVLEMLQELAGDDIDGLASDIDFARMEGLI